MLSPRGFLNAHCAHFSLSSTCPLTLSTKVGHRATRQLAACQLKRAVKKICLASSFEARNGFASLYLAELFRYCTVVLALSLFDSPTMAVPLITLKTVGVRLVCAAGSRVWNSLPHSLCAGILVCHEATPCSFSTLTWCYLSATNDLSTFFSSFLATSAAGSRSESVTIALNSLWSIYIISLRE